MIKSPKGPSRISEIPFIIKVMYNDQYLTHATGFIYRFQDENYLVTNWHVLAGRNALTFKPLSQASSPNKLIIYPTTLRDEHSIARLTSGLTVPIGDIDAKLWLEHPVHQNLIDVGMIKLGKCDFDFIHVNTSINALDTLEIFEAQDVFILGYPLIDYITHGFPIWKRGTIATSPAFDVEDLPKFLIDTATRPGMSGAPVFASANYVVGKEIDGSIGQLKANSSLFVMPIFEFLGIYSGRIGSSDVDGIQLGIVWRLSVLDEIITGNKLYDEYEVLGKIEGG